MSVSYLLKGALVEYGVGLGASIPNIVIFQFNPDTITRTLEIPAKPTGSGLRETNQAGDIPIERISLTAQFTIHEMNARLRPLSVAVGIGPQLAALEKLARPSTWGKSLRDQAVDKLKEKVTKAGTEATQMIPRESYPRLLFVWGAARVLPVTIDSMSIVEKQHDALLNPTQADVTISLSVLSIDPCSDDRIAKGAATYSVYVRDALAAANTVDNAAQVLDLIQF
jgi:hypothetical protein